MPNAISLNLATPTPDIRSSSGLTDAAEKFESLLIAQMLRSARETDQGGWSGEADQSGSSMMDMAEQHLADLLGSQGALGIARMIIKKVDQ